MPEPKKNNGQRYKGRVNARGIIKKRVVLGAIGEPGRFTIAGRGIRQGVKHFSC